MRTLTLAGTVLTATALLAGCGESNDDVSGAATGGGASGGEVAFAEQEAGDIVKASKAAMAGLSSLHVAGQFTKDGGTVVVDVAVGDGGACRGSVETPDGQRMELLGVGDTIWVRPDDAFWRASLGEKADAFLASLGDKWTLFPRELGYEVFCDFEDIIGDSAEDETYETGDVTDVDGTPAVAVTGTDEDGVETVGYVQTEDEHYLVKVESDGVDVTYSDFDVPVDAEKPGADEVLDISQLD